MVSREEVKWLDILHFIKEVEGKSLERVIMRVKDNTRASVVRGEFTWELTTHRSKSKKNKIGDGTLAQQLARLEMRMAGIKKEEGSDNETIVRMTVKKRKRVLRKGDTSFFQIEEEMEIECIQLAERKLFEAVKTNIFETAPLSWKLEDCQKGWSQEGVKGTMEAEDKRGKEEIKDSQMKDEEPIQTANSKEDLKQWMKQENNNTLKVTWRPSVGSLTSEVDIEMKAAAKVTEGLKRSKYAVKQLSEKEINK